MYVTFLHETHKLSQREGEVDVYYIAQSSSPDNKTAVRISRLKIQSFGPENERVGSSLGFGSAGSADGPALQRTGGGRARSLEAPVGWRMWSRIACAALRATE